MSVRHLFVCHSLRRYSIETAKHIIKLFFTVGYPHHSSFSVLNGMVIAYSDGDPPNGFESKGYEKIAIFRPISRFISEMIQNRAI